MGLTMGKAYPDDDAARNGQQRSGIKQPGPDDDAARNGQQWGHPQPRSGEGASGIK
jgi:hypothetical protein